MQPFPTTIIAIMHTRVHAAYYKKITSLSYRIRPKVKNAEKRANSSGARNRWKYLKKKEEAKEQKKKREKECM